jgi:hypothetical protein
MEDDGPSLLESERRETVRNAANAARERARALVARALSLQAAASLTAARSTELSVEANAVRDELREGVVAHARSAFLRGELPEALVIDVKAMVEDAAREAFSAKRLLDWTQVQRMREDILGWSIQAYYQSQAQ